MLSFPLGAVIIGALMQQQDYQEAREKDLSVEDVELSRAQLHRLYHFEKRLGKGGFGDVWLATDTRTGRLVAIKLLSLERLPRSMVEQEVVAMRRCGRHPNVVELLAVVWITPDNSNSFGEAALVMELAAGGGLFERLVSEGAYTEQLASKIIRQVARAIYHLHSRGIVHRDIKPENVVMESLERDSAVKLIDFGTAIALEEEAEMVTGGGRIGTWSYWAPEQLNQQPYDFAVDMWSLGVVLYILLVGFHPFDPEGEASEQQILSNMKAGNVPYETEEWSGVSTQAKLLVQSLLQAEPSKRCTAAELISHPWVLGRDVPGSPMPATHERLRAFTQARHAFYGSLLMGILLHQIAAGADAEGMGAAGGEFDVWRQGWRLFDRDNKGHINAGDMRRVCVEMGYKVTQKDVENMLLVLSPTAAIAIETEGEMSAPAANTAASAEGAGQQGGFVSFERYRKTMQACFSRSFDKGQYIFKEGDKVEAFFVIVKGQCEVSVSRADGATVLATLGPGDFFGETAIVEGRETRAASVRVTAPMEVLAIDRHVFQELAKPESESKLSQSMHERAEARQRARLIKVFEKVSLSLKQKRILPKGSIVFKQGDKADHFFITNSGLLEMSVTTDEGHSVRVKRLRAGDQFGYDAFLSDVHDTTVTCLTDVELTAVPQRELKLAVSKDAYLGSTFKARRDLSFKQLIKLQGEAQLLPMMAKAAAAGSSVDYAKFEAMLEEMSSIELCENQPVFNQGDEPAAVYFVIGGKLNCERESQRTGQVRVVATLGPGDHFGETAMLENRKQRNVTVRCIEPECLLRSLPITRFREILSESRQLAQATHRAAEMRTNRRVRNVLNAASTVQEARSIQYEPGDVIFKQGDKSGAFYVIESGEVQMSLVGEGDTRSIPVRRYNVGDCFGASGLMQGDSLRRDTATAVTPVKVKVIPHHAFRVMLKDDDFLQAGLRATSVLRMQKTIGHEEKASPADEWRDL